MFVGDVGNVTPIIDRVRLRLAAVEQQNGVVNRTKNIDEMADKVGGMTPAIAWAVIASIVLFLVVAFLWNWSRSTRTVVIHSARWIPETESRDVRTLLTQRIKDGRVSLSANRAAFGDLSPGQHKCLVVTYSVNDSDPIEAVIPEDGDVRIG